MIAGSNNSYIATLVERHSRFAMLAKIENKDTQSVITALVKQARKLPKELYISLTWGRGSEMAAHRTFTMATKIGVYFATSNHLGREAEMKIPTVISDNTSLKALIYHASAKLNSAQPPANSMSGQERHCNTRHQQRNLKPVLQRPVEITAGSRLGRGF